MLLLTRYRLVIWISLFLPSLLVHAQNPIKLTGQDSIRLQAEAEEQRLIDPVLKRVPYERLDQTRHNLVKNSLANARAGIPNVTWQERGPNNSGGRSRALLFDPNDATHKKAWVGSVAGGLWYTNDITDAAATWMPVSDAWENMVVTAIAADPSNPQVMYVGTGDAYNYTVGGGIWKTTNGGADWVRLTGTIPTSSYSSAISYSFSYIQRIVVNSSGQVFAATRQGLVRSVDGGTTWQYVLAPNQGIGAGSSTGNYGNDLVTDLELAADGILYAAFNPSRVFRSTNATGTSWTEITPTSAGGERTELALVLSTSGSGQVIYGVSQAYNSASYAQDVKWFKKSINGGASWTDVTIPTFGSSSHFTSGGGYYALTLAVHPTDPNTIYAGGYDWARSTDGGATWSGRLTSFYAYQQGLWFQPGGNTAVALVSENAAYWSPDWGNNSQTSPTTSVRNKGYRAGEVSSVAMRSSPGSPYLLTGVGPTGFYQLNATGLSEGTLFWGSSRPGLTFIDENVPVIQLLQSYNQIFAYNSSGSTQLTSVNSYYLPSYATEYDGQNNTLYVADNQNNQSFIRKISGVGSTVQSTTLTLSGITNLASYLKLSIDRTKLYLGTGSGQIYQITDLSQSSPTVTKIDNGALPTYSTVSSIDVGADNELLVTFTSYGIQSVWYTNNGGTTWTGKDQTNFGLPDVPVRAGLFNPQNRKQVLLGTDAGIWTTDDITATNPGWAYSGSGMGPVRVNQLRYRASDGRITAASNGRGIWATDAFAVPYTPSSVAITNVSNTTLCAGSTFAVSFTTTGTASNAGNTFEVWLSDANGSFVNQKKLASGTTSPISVTLPGGYSALPYGTNYQVKIIAPNADVTSDPSSLAIGNLNNASVYDRRAEVNYSVTGGAICSGSQAVLRTYAFDANQVSTSAESYQWLLNGSVVDGATSFTLAAQQTGTYSVVLKQAGCMLTSTTYRLSYYTLPTYPYTSVIAVSSQPRCDDPGTKLITGYIGQTARYQWALNGVDITGATSYSYNATQTGSYSCVVTESNCTFMAASTYFQVGRSINAVISPVGLYQRADGDTTLCNYSAGILSSNSQSSDGYSFQWYRDGVQIQGATYSNYSPYQPGVYSLLLKQGTCQAFSNAIAIRPSGFKASISATFSAQNACPGETQSLIAVPSINASFQWQKDGVDIAGATLATLVPGTTGTYTVRVTRGSCVATSEPLSLTFSNDLKPTVSASETCYGGYLLVNGLFNKTGYQYQWYRSGVVMNGSTNASLLVFQPGTYSVRVTNGSCAGLSREVYIAATGDQLPKPVVSASSRAFRPCENNSIQLVVTKYNGSLQWKRNGTVIQGATLSSYYATQTGFYSVVSQDGTCQTESDPIEVKIGEATTAALSGTALISSGQSAQLPVTFSGPAPWSFTLTNGQSVTATYQNPAFISVSPTSNTTYQLASVANACGLGSTSGQAVVSVGTGSADVSLSMAVDRRVSNVGETITYTMAATNAGPNDAAGIQLSSVLPVGLSFIGSDSPGVSAANGIVTANLGAIPANTISAVSFRAAPTQPGVFATAAQLTTTQTPDPDSQPNSGTGDGQDDAASIDVRTPSEGTLVTSANPNQVPLPAVLGNQPTPSLNSADLSLSMQVDKLTAEPNGVVTATLTVSNRGGSSASSVMVQVVLPNGAFGAQNPVGWLPVDGQPLTYKRIINTLAAGQSTAITLQWQPAATGMVKAQIFDVSEPDPDSTPGNGYAQGEDDEAAMLIRIR